MKINLILIVLLFGLSSPLYGKDKFDNLGSTHALAVIGGTYVINKLGSDLLPNDPELVDFITLFSANSISQYWCDRENKARGYKDFEDWYLDSKLDCLLPKLSSKWIVKELKLVNDNYWSIEFSDISDPTNGFLINYTLDF